MPRWVERSETSLNPILLACFDEFEAIFAIRFPAMIRRHADVNDRGVARVVRRRRRRL
jgi:hypothetical protein